MGTQVLTNPASAFYPTADFTTFKYDNGNIHDYPREVDTWIANDTIAQFDWVSFVAASATQEVRVEKMDVSDATSSTLMCGVALEAAVAGDRVQVCVRGPVLCNINDTGAIVAGDLAVEHATADGASGVVAIGALAAGTIVTTILGVYLGPEVGTTNFAPVNVKHM